MDIKLRARLSAYSKLDGVIPEECKHDRVTEQEIDLLFGQHTVLPSDPDNVNPNRVTEAEIDSLFR